MSVSPENQNSPLPYRMKPCAGAQMAILIWYRDWGIERVSFISLLASKAGLERVASVWPEGTDFYIGAVDDGLDDHGYVQPGVGDIGDRLYGTELA